MKCHQKYLPNVSRLPTYRPCRRWILGMFSMAR